MDKILDVIATSLRNIKNVKVTGRSQKPLQVRVTYGSQSIEADIIPACDLDVLPEENVNIRERVYREIQMQSNDEVKEFYTPSLSGLQIEFVKSQPTNVKSLIRLIKYWKATCLRDMQGPSSLLVELITIDQWEKADEPDRFDMRKGLYSVLNALVDYTSLDAEWFEYYSEDLARELVRHRKPYVIDPDNPFCNLVSKYKFWPQLAEKAKEFLEKPLFTVPAVPTDDWDSY